MAAADPRPSFENHVGRLYGHPDGYALLRFHPGPRNFIELQQLLNQTRRLMDLHRWPRFLTDQRQMAPYTPEEAAWLVDHWRAAAAEHPGGLYGAVVMAHNVFARLVMGQIVQQANSAALHLRRFETEAEATTWLEQVG